MHACMYFYHNLCSTTQHKFGQTIQIPHSKMLITQHKLPTSELRQNNNTKSRLSVNCISTRNLVVVQVECPRALDCNSEEAYILIQSNGSEQLVLAHLPGRKFKQQKIHCDFSDDGYSFFDNYVTPPPVRQDENSKTRYVQKNKTPGERNYLTS